MTRLESAEPHWIPLNKQHKDLYDELREFLVSDCFKKVE